MWRGKLYCGCFVRIATMGIGRHSVFGSSFNDSLWSRVEELGVVRSSVKDQQRNYSRLVERRVIGTNRGRYR